MSNRFRPSQSERLVEILRHVGVAVEWHNIWCQLGAHRRADCARWGVSHAQPRPPLMAAAGPWSGLYHVHSWDTMTECVRRGIQIAVDGTEIEVHSLPAKESA